MDNITRAQLDALEGKRAPPDCTFLMGAGEYRSQLLLPSLQRDAKMRDIAQRTTNIKNMNMNNTANKLGSGAAWNTVREGQIPGGDNNVSLPDALAIAEATMVASEPVHVYDLKETAARKTQELIEKEKMVLHYKVYTMENIENSQLETQRARIMEFFYRISDGTLHVYEPQITNSGLWQGDFTKKHIPFKPENNGSVYGPNDFMIGSTVWVSGRNFTIVDADQRTRNLVLERYGIHLGSAIPIPETYVAPVGAPVGHHPKGNKLVCDMGDMEDPIKGFYKRAPDMKGKFLEHGSSMLRFECEWRETGEPFGDRRRFALQYYLADDTLEVLDKSSAYARGGQFTKFIIRQRLPRLPLEEGVESVVPIMAGKLSSANAMAGTDAQKAANQGIILPNAQEVMTMSAVARSKYKYTTGPTVWSKTTSPITGDPVYRPTTSKGSKTPGSALPGPATIGGFPVLSSLVDKPEFITAGDLICGGVISVFGRPLLLKSCDPFTVAFCLHKLGIDQRRGFIMDESTVATERAAVTPHLMPRGTVPLAPHTGVIALGSEEETRVNAKKIVPTYRAERDFDNFYQLSGKILRFEARMDPATCDPDDARREFVVSFYLEDNTMAIVEVLRDRKGASAVRWLSRGKHRNFRGEPDMEEAAAVLGHRPPVELELDTQAAYDRIYSSPGDRFGYGDGFGGQGYSGGIFGKADRVGAGGTGVPSRTDVGIRDPMTHAYSPPPRYFRSDDFYVGATFQLAHAPSQTFILGRPDGFTADYLAAREAQQVSNARDVYVADSRVPVPNLPLEATTTTAFNEATEITVPLDATESITLNADVHDGCLVLAKILAGVLFSAQEVVRQSDKGKHNLAPVSVVQAALERYGCRAPAVDSEIVETVLQNFVVGTAGDMLAEKQAQENARATKHAPYRPKTPANQTVNQTPGGSPLGVSRGSNINGMGTVATMENPLHGPHFTDYLTTSGYENVLLVDYPKLFRTIKGVADRQQVLQPRLDKIISQLRMALMSSRTHLRRVFRDLDTTGRGIITFTEFRRMLLRHHLDIGLNDAQIRALLARFPPADPMQAAGLNEPAISWQGFVEVIVDAKTLAPGEMEQFLDFVRGARDDAPDGVGGTRVWPELYPHVNQVSSWTPDMDLSRFGVQENKAVNAKNTMTGTAASRSIVPPTVPVRAAIPTRPYTATGMSNTISAANGPSHTLPIGGAPELPTSRPRTAPQGSMDPRPAPEHAVLDVVEALSGSAMGKSVLQRMRDVFGTKRLELFRALSLYDTTRKHVLSVHSFVAAVVSAGLRLSTTQAADLTREICRMAGGNTGLIPPATDVFVDYNAFLDTLYA